MSYIVSYRKHIDNLRTVELALPEDAETHQRIGTELATIDDVTYVALPEGVVLPNPQPAEITASISTAAIDQATKEIIKSVSPHSLLINDRMQSMIRDSYPLEDELKYARIGAGAAMGMYTPTQEEINDMTVFGEFIESVRQWGRDERAKIGL